MALTKLEDLEKFITILIVDDNEDERKSLVDALEQEKYETIWAVETTEEAFDYLQYTNILLADYQLPTSKLQDGIALVDMAKKQYGDKIQTVVFSGKNGDFEDVKKKTIKANAAAFFEKPVKTEYIKVWIRELSKRIWYQQILDADPDEVLIRSHEGTILYTCDEKERIFGNDLIGNKCYLKFEERYPPDQKCLICPDDIAFNSIGNTPVRTEWNYITRGDTTQHKIHQKNQTIDLVAAPLVDRQNIHRAIIEIARDITIRKTAEKIIDKMEEESDWVKRRKIFMDGFEKLGIHRARLYLLDKRKDLDLFRLVDYRGIYDGDIFESRNKWEFNLIEDGTTLKILEMKKPLIFCLDEKNDDRIIEVDFINPNLFWVGKNNINNFLSLVKDEWIDIPLIIALENIIGKVTIDGWKGKGHERPDNYDLEVLEHYCAAAGQIIHNARQKSIMERRNKIKAGIIDISKEITNIQNSNLLLKNTVKLICEIMEIQFATIFLNEENKLITKQSYAFNKNGIPINNIDFHEVYKENEYLCGKAFNKGLEIFYNNLQDIIKKEREHVTKGAVYLPAIDHFEKLLETPFRNVVFAPLYVGNEIIGVLRMVNKLRKNDFNDADFDDLDKEMINLLSGQVAIAIFNANLQKEKEQVFLNVSHSLVSPINSLKLSVEMLIDGLIAEPDNLEQYLEMIYVDIELLSNLAERVLSLSRIEAKSITIDRKDISINDIIEEAIKMNKSISKEKSINIRKNLDLQNPTIKLDKNLFLVALQGILDNAIKFSKNNKCIEISTCLERQLLLIKIKDEGIGIPEEEIDKIWTKNYRGKYAQEEKIYGSGIGLTVTKEIIRMHGGEVNIESEVGVGSTFTIQLELNKP